MTDRAPSLLRTVFLPVLQTLRRRAGRGTLPVGPHHGVPAVQLSGVILNRHTTADPAEAGRMYGGTYEFAGECVEALPDEIFSRTAPNAGWRSGLLGLSWLASFRASARPLHGLFALRLLAEWMKADPKAASRGDRISALFHLAMDAPAIAATQSPAAVALANAAILRAQHPVAKIKPATAEEAFGKTMALLAAHLATRRGDRERDRLLTDLVNALWALLNNDGSPRDGTIDGLCRMYADLVSVTEGLDRSGDPVPPVLTAQVRCMARYLSLLLRPDGTLAFADDAGLKPPHGIAMAQGIAMAPDAGQARLVGGNTLLLASIGPAGRNQPLRMEMSDASRPLFWLERARPMSAGHDPCTLICASGGSLLEVRSSVRPQAPDVAVFLSSDGTDVRLEDRPGENTLAYALHVLDMTRLTTTHGGTGAMIVPATGQPWQLLVRGARIEVEQGRLSVISGGQASQPVNLALKRMAKPDRAARGGKSRDPGSTAPRLL